MKNTVTALLMIHSAFTMAQVAVGKPSVSSPSVSLEFGAGNRGMILPWVISGASVTGAVNGTMVYDLADNKVKVKYNAAWKDLSVDNTGTTVDALTAVDGVLIQSAETENVLAQSGVGIMDATPGILVLGDTDKAMVLPKVDSPHLNIIDPSPGMMAYDTFNKQLAVFNGSVWTFWRP